ncbi:MAG: 16S rRNA (cytosine(967)-C(5))-methyltransferase RsmB [Pseudomonadota bacterium]
MSPRRGPHRTGQGKTPPAPGGRGVAAKALQRVLDQGQALDQALDQELDALDSGPDRALARRLSYSVLRDWPAVQGLTAQLLQRAPARRDRLVLFVIAVALAELRDGREPAHAVVHSAVNESRSLGLGRLSGLVNAVLRRYLRESDELTRELGDNPVTRFGHPSWLIKAIRVDWPDDWEALLEQSNLPPPLWLRVNQRYWSRDEALRALREAGFEARIPDQTLPDALLLSQRARISELPGFAEGSLSIQDGAAQLTAEYLALEDGQRVLDACSAPGGKAAHVLERVDVKLTAIDLDRQRLDRVGQTLDRLGLAAELVAADGTRPDDWWDGKPFDRILIDAPCSATGVIRRHPDIRWLRKAADIPRLVETQRELLQGLWPLLAPGGILVYSTCSILAAENAEQAQAFIESRDDCEPIDHPHFPGREQRYGRQILPGDGDLDGFYHVALRRLQRGP